MKTLLQTLFFFLLATQICFAQWYQQNSGTTKNLHAVHFIDENIGIAVGDSGTILRTTNGGTAWAIQASGTILPLNDICFTDEYNGWIVGADGIILHTTDNGTTWLPQTSGITDELKGVCFIDANTVWAVGYWSIIKTTNGGSTWINQPNPSLLPLEDVCFTDANIGVVVGGGYGMYSAVGTILRTTDGGATWTEQLNDSINTYLQGIAFTGADLGIVVGHNYRYLGYAGPCILRTTDGGITWTPVLVTDIISFHSVALTDPNNVWAAGVQYGSTIGTIFYTNNGGLTWTSQLSDFPNSFNCVNFTDPLTGWAVGDNGTILHTTNGGVPVELTSFTATTNGNEATLNWSTATELNNQGFEIQRSKEGKEFFTVGFVDGHGTTTEQQNYSYTDRNLDDGKYYYRLKQVDYDGSYEYSDVVEIDFKTFNSYLLEQCYPNPFNPATTIGFVLQNKTNVKITVLNSIGEEVAVILNEEREAGFHRVEFNAVGLPSGVYFYQLRAGDFVETKKMVLMK